MSRLGPSPTVWGFSFKLVSSFIVTIVISKSHPRSAAAWVECDWWSQTCTPALMTKPDAHPGPKPIFQASWPSEPPCEPWEPWLSCHSLKGTLHSITPECGSFFHHHWKSKPVPVCGHLSSLSPFHGYYIFIRSFEILPQWAFCSPLSNQWPSTGSVFSAVYPKSAGCPQNPHFNHAFASGLKKKNHCLTPQIKSQLSSIIHVIF